jgi:cardiolipin synthase
MLGKSGNILKEGHQIKLLQSGDEYFTALHEYIGSAKQSIHLQVYIYDDDETGHCVTDLLCKAAKRGVAVEVMVDAFGSGDLSAETITKLTQAGIRFKKFSPLFTTKGFHVGLRLHHKIALFDGQTALIGGINIANKYRGDAANIPWLDFAVEIKGPCTQDIEEVCKVIWQKNNVRKPKPIQSENGGMQARILQNDWLRRKIEISTAYRQAIRKADKEIVLVASYFLPGIRIRRLLKNARKRGVCITVLLGGVSDVQSVKRASNYLYGWLIRNGIKIYEWKPSVLHGKIALVDGKWVTIGSYNINFLSDYGSLELNAEIEDEEFASAVHRRIENVIAEGCEEITVEKYKQTSLCGIFLDWLSYQLIRTSFKIMYLLMKRE